MTTTDGPDPRQAVVQALAAPAAHAHLTFAWRPNPPTYKVELVELEENVSATFLGYAQGAAASLVQRLAIDYDPDWPLRDHEYFSLPNDQVPGDNLFPALADFQNLRTFRKKSLTKPRLYVVAIQTPNGTAAFGKRMAYLKVLKQAKGVFAAVWDGSTFNALTDSVATFSTSFDWVYWADTLYVLDAGGFHAEFRDLALIQEAVADDMAGISQRLTIRNAALMSDRCRANIAMASKLRRVAERGLHLTATVSELKGYATQYGIHVDWEGDALVFDGSMQCQWDILKLLDEDRTQGAPEPSPLRIGGEARGLGPGSGVREGCPKRQSRVIISRPAASLWAPPTTNDPSTFRQMRRRGVERRTSCGPASSALTALTSERLWHGSPDRHNRVGVVVRADRSSRDCPARYSADSARASRPCDRRGSSPSHTLAYEYASPAAPPWHLGHFRWKLSDPLHPYSSPQRPHLST